MNPSSAGSRVTAESTVATTVTAAPSAIPVTSPNPSVVMPSSAATTVSPAKTTARPEVFRAVAIESPTPIPAIRFPRCRFTMNSA